MYCRIPADLRYNGLEELARRLHELNEFEVIVAYAYETFGGARIDKEDVIPGSFAAFAKGVESTWEEYAGRAVPDPEAMRLLLIVARNKPSS